ncbi:MAG: hypothetical protein QOF33_1868 [Thermomicrobiales bacterium]|jgi:hypothetical protein|nr:hypothetical protein [Thermomicrobiales bacterium]
MLDELEERTAVVIPKIIDIDDEPQLLRLVNAIREGHEPVRLQRAGEDLAVVTPVYGSPEVSRPRPIQTPEDLAEFLSIAGEWAGTDTEVLVEDIYRQRRISTRSPVDL